VGIVRTNGLPVETAEGDMVGVYPTVSRFNHSCNNNVDASVSLVWALPSGYRRILAQSGAYTMFKLMFAGNSGAEHRFVTTAPIQHGQQSYAFTVMIKRIPIVA